MNVKCGVLIPTITLFWLGSLTDGTVIQDMELSGKVLSQPLEAYPPLFREAIGYLRNHGSVTLVVPPELAYGEAGYSPKIPPHTTMIYELRIEDVKAAVMK
jgi:FKBP-type peptidyl-prolyl cis-trans isomerase